MTGDVEAECAEVVPDFGKRRTEAVEVRIAESIAGAELRLPQPGVVQADGPRCEVESGIESFPIAEEVAFGN